MSLIQADASLLPLHSGSVDAVVCVNAFLFPAEYRRVLRSGGAVVFVSTRGDHTPIYLPPAEVARALGARNGVTSEAGTGTWTAVKEEKTMTDLAAIARHVDDLWEESVMPVLSSYVGIRCLSPDFDPAWAENGEIGRAARLLSEWAASRPIPGCTVELVEREGLTPVVIADVPATPGSASELVTLLYGHLDKQPPLGSWRDGLDPFVAVREGDRLYGSGTADDGYSIFAAVGALEALAATGTPHGRCVVIIEASEESGSPHLGPYLEDVEARIGARGTRARRLPGLGMRDLRPALDNDLAPRQRGRDPDRGGALRGRPQRARRRRRPLLVPPSPPAPVAPRGRDDRGDPRAGVPGGADSRGTGPTAEAMAAELGDAAGGEFPTVPGPAAVRYARRRPGAPPHLDGFARRHGDGRHAPR